MTMKKSALISASISPANWSPASPLSNEMDRAGAALR
jgi:hypothetical protein